MKLTHLLIFFLFLAAASASGKVPLSLKENLGHARVGDYIVSCQSKNYTLLSVMEKSDRRLTFQEITVPASRLPRKGHDWRQWVAEGAPRHTSWAIFIMNLQTGQMDEYFSVTKNCWCHIPQAESFLSTLLTLQLKPVPNEQKKRVGPPPLFHGKDSRPFWQPRMRFNGELVNEVPFNVYRTEWPQDGSDLSGHVIELYLPEAGQYPDYFPYWLHVNGLGNKAKVRIVDSGTNLQMPEAPLAWRIRQG